MSEKENILKKISEDVAGNNVALYMKGTASFPQCGFSAVVAEVLNRLNVEFKDINVLADPILREAIKEYSEWPTIPQLYVKGEFVGGCDIVREMYQAGELQTLLKEKKVPFQEEV